MLEVRARSDVVQQLSRSHWQAKDSLQQQRAGRAQGGADQDGARVGAERERERERKHLSSHTRLMQVLPGHPLADQEYTIRKSELHVRQILVPLSDGDRAPPGRPRPAGTPGTCPNKPV